MSDHGVFQPEAEKTERKRHPSTLIPVETIREINYRLWLRRLDPPMTPEQSAATTRTDQAGNVTSSDELRRSWSRAYDSLTRDYLRVLVDMGLVKP